MPAVAGIPMTRYWLIPARVRPKMFTPHPSMSSEEIRERTQRVWDRFYSWSAVWERSACVKSLRGRMAFMLISRLYRQMYANTGISTDSARRSRASVWAGLLAKPCRRLFQGRPMPELQVPMGSLPSKNLLHVLN
ncbi:MAG TPA: radical SAM protein, partial [Casimicrobiaceae bacterium]